MLNDEDRSESLPSILVIDDDEISLALICMILEAEGYPTIGIPDGTLAVKKVVELADGEEPSVVLADLQMPGLSGWELAMAMRIVLPYAAILAMSATRASATDGSIDGYDGFVGKPLDPGVLRSVLSDIGDRPDSANVIDSMDADAPDLNEEVYRKLSGMMTPTALAEVYEVCLRDARSRAAEMRKLAEEVGPELRAVRRSAHAIKGGAGMVGALRLASAAARLELGVYGKDDLPALINNLLDSCDHLQRILIGKAEASRSVSHYE